MWMRCPPLLSLASGHALDSCENENPKGIPQQHKSFTVATLANSSPVSDSLLVRFLLQSDVAEKALNLVLTGPQRTVEWGRLNHQLGLAPPQIHQGPPLQLFVPQKASNLLGIMLGRIQFCIASYRFTSISLPKNSGKESYRSRIHVARPESWLNGGGTQMCALLGAEQELMIWCTDFSSLVLIRIRSKKEASFSFSLERM